MDMRTPWVLRSQIFLSALLAVAMFALALVTWESNRVFDPLIPFKTQQVLSRTKDRAGPSIEVSMNLSAPLPTVSVVGRKCYREDTEVTATRSWRSVYPPGFDLFDVTDGSAFKPEGCDGSTIARPFQNPLPSAVAATVRALYLNQGTRVTRWVIQGLLTPISPDGHKVIPRHWETEQFTIAIVK